MSATITAPKTSRQFGSTVRAAIRRRISGATITGLTVKAVNYPTGVKGFTATGTATAQGKTARFFAMGTVIGFEVSFYDEVTA